MANVADDDPFFDELTRAALEPVDDREPCCRALHHWPPGARCDRDVVAGRC